MPFRYHTGIILLLLIALFYGIRNTWFKKTWARIFFTLLAFIFLFIGTYLYINQYSQTQKTKAAADTCWWVNDAVDGNWNNATNWANSEGGVGGTCDGGVVPGADDNAYFSNTSSPDNSTLSGNADCLNLYTDNADHGGTDDYTGTLDAATFDMDVAGNMYFKSGSLDLGSGTWTVPGNWNTNGVDFIYTAGSTVVMAGTIKTIRTGYGENFYNLTYSGSTALYSANYHYIDHTLTVSGTVTLPSGSIRLSNGSTSDFTGGTVGGGSGSIYVYGTAILSAAGTISTSVSFISTDADSSMPARTYGRGVVVNSDSGTPRTLQMAEGIINISGNLSVRAHNTANMTLDGATNDPTVNIAGYIVYDGYGGGTEIIQAGDGTWTVADDITINQGTLIADGSTFVLNGSAESPRLYSGPNSFNNLTIKNTNVNGTRLLDTLTVAGNLTVQADGDSAVTFNNSYNKAVNVTGNLVTAGAGSGAKNIKMGTSTWTVGGDVNFTDGTITDGTSTLVMDGTGTKTLTTNNQTLYNFTPTNTTGSNQTVAVSGTLNIANDLNIAASAVGNKTLDAATNNPDVNIIGDLDFTGVGVGTESISMGSGTWTVDGDVNFTNGTITAGNSTLDLSGTADQSLTSAGQTLYNLTVSNPSALSTFIVGDTAATTFTAITPSSRLVFTAGATYTFTNININGQVVGTRIVLVGSTPGNAWNLIVSGSQSVSYVDVSDSDASGGNQIDASDGTNLNSGGNPNWLFVSGNGDNGDIYEGDLPGQLPETGRTLLALLGLALIPILSLWHFMIHRKKRI